MTARKRSKKRVRGARGALWLVALLLFASGALRLSNGTGIALARGAADLAAPQPVATAPLSCEPPADIAAVLQALQERSRSLAEREAAFADRMAALKLADAEIERKLAALEVAEQKLAGTLALADQAAETDLGRLTEVYESMKPKEAAALFQEMAPEFAAGFLGRMRPEAAAAVMAGLSPQAAYTISVLLAGRNANAPTE